MYVCHSSSNFGSCRNCQNVFSGCWGHILHCLTSIDLSLGTAEHVMFHCSIKKESWICNYFQVHLLCVVTVITWERQIGNLIENVFFLLVVLEDSSALEPFNTKIICLWSVWVLFGVWLVCLISAFSVTSVTVKASTCDRISRNI